MNYKKEIFLVSPFEERDVEYPMLKKALEARGENVRLYSIGSGDKQIDLQKDYSLRLAAGEMNQKNSIVCFDHDPRDVFMDKIQQAYMGFIGHFKDNDITVITHLNRKRDMGDFRFRYSLERLGENSYILAPDQNSIRDICRNYSLHPDRIGHIEGSHNSAEDVAESMINAARYVREGRDTAKEPLEGLLKKSSERPEIVLK